MRFLCDSCQTRYTLADEKVRGRVLRVRCKTCGAAIVVRESGAQTVVGETPGPMRTTSSAGMVRATTPAGGVARTSTPARGITRPPEFTPPAESSPPRDPSQLPVDWFAMLQGKQEGPFTEKAMLARIAEGSIGPRTFIWSDSMSDWKRAAEVPAFASRFATSVTPPRPPPARAEFDPFASVGGEPAAAPRGEPVPAVDPHSLTPSGLPGAEPTGESTRLVMMQAGVDSRGRKKRAARLLMVGGGFVALAGLTVLLLPTSVLPAAPRAPGGKPQSSAPWTAEGMEALRDKLLGRDADGQVAAAPRGPRSARPRDDGAVIHRQDPRPTGQVSDATKDELANLYGDTSKHDAKIEVKTPDAPKADKAALDPTAISKTVSDNAGAYKRCIDDYLRRNPSFHGGKVEITATIAPSGIVTSASLSDRGVEGSDLGACLRDRTKRMIFPRFEGDPFDVTYPLVLASGGE